VIARVELDIDRDPGGLGLGGISAVEGCGLENLVLEVGQAVGFPVFLVLLQGLPLDHALPLPVGLEEFQLLVECHVFQVRDRGLPGSGRRKPREIPLDPQCVASQLQLVVLAAPSPKCIWISIDTLVIRGRKTDNPSEILGIVRIPVPAPSNVVGNRWKLGIGLVELLRGQQVDVVKDENIVLLSVLALVLAGHVEANVQELSPIEFAAVVGLFHDVDVIVADPPLLGPEVSQELDHVRNELGEVLRSFLFRVQIPERNDDGHAGRVGNVQESVDVQQRRGRSGRLLLLGGSR